MLLVTSQVVSEITNVVNNKESHMSPEGIKALTDILVEKSRLYALSLKEFGALNPQDQVTIFNLDVLYNSTFYWI